MIISWYHIDTSNKYFGHAGCSKWLFSLKKSHLWSANKIHRKSIRGVAFSTATSFCSKLSCCRVTAIIRFFQLCYVTDTSPLGQPWWNFYSIQCSWTVESYRKGSCETPTAIQKCICIHNGTYCNGYQTLKPTQRWQFQTLIDGSVDPMVFLWKNQQL